MEVNFTKNFLWGAATSAYQYEGGNFNTDWAQWEKENILDECGWACNHYETFRHDFDLAKKLNLNSLRISIEWARICPEREKINFGEIKHYKCVIKELRKRGLEPIVTLHHFTNPVWFSRSGGWLNKKNIDKFVEYALLMVRELNADVTWWIVFNEPMVFLYNGFIEGIWPPGIKSLKSANKALDNVLAAYKIIYNEIKNIYRKIHKNSMVSVAKHMVIFKPCERGVKWLNAVSAGLRDKLFNYYFLDKIIEDNCLDYVAINYYRQQFITFKGFLGAECEGGKHHMVRKNAMGWYVYPHGLYEIISEIKRYNLPIMITENGTAEEDQQYYIETLLEHMRALAMAVSEGADVRGYMYWSLLDNFEWDKGFSKRFGLIKVNYNDMKRTIRESGKIYSSICADNKICL